MQTAKLKPIEKIQKAGGTGVFLGGDAFSCAERLKLTAKAYVFVSTLPIEICNGRW